MTTRRLVMMALTVSFGSAMSASAQTPANSVLIGILKRSAKTTSAVVPTVTTNLVPVGTPSGSSTISPLVDTPKAPPATECGPRPPRPV